MPGTFPTLSTGAAAQYPLDRRIERAAEQLEFLSLARQVYRERSRRRWIIALELLDESEVATLREFFDQQRGRWGTFTFTDPADGSPRQCSFAEDAFPRRRNAAGFGSRLTVYEHA
jgi:hypothetical protein